MQWPPLDGLPDISAALPSRPHALTPALPFVRDDAGNKSLYFSLDELQSRMDSRKPWLLEVDYTRTMMGFLMFKPAPVHIGMIGLGGGSLAKFCYRQLPASRITVAEINPHIIALRREFMIPDDDHRLTVLQCDGADFVAEQAGGLDALLVDGFDEQGQPPALCSQAFYDDCARALTADGVLAVNLHHDSPDYAVCLARLQRSFAGNVVEAAALEKSNCIVFASRTPLPSRQRLDLRTALSGMDREARKQLQPEFARMVWCMSSTGDED
ncbi:MAG: fused MFS/spermidine synthase [Pseudomonadota bacterium]